MNAQEERTALLRESARSWRKEGLIGAAAAQRIDAELAAPWRTNGVVLQAVFFVLTCIALSTFYGLCNLLNLPGEGIVTGVIALVAAEFLISRGWVRTGVESALWIGGVFALISELPRRGTPESLLVIAAGAAVAGARVRNPLFGALAAVLVSVYAEERFDLGVVAALIIAVVAMIALLREWRRPSTEWLWIELAVLLPIAGRFLADDRWRVVTVLLYTAFSLIALILAIRARHHAIFVAALVGAGIAGFDTQRLVAISAESLYAIVGALLLLTAWAIARALRERTHGIVTTPSKLTGFDDAVEIAATIATKPEAQEPAPEKEGGAFGGAGASGEY